MVKHVIKNEKEPKELKIMWSLVIKGESINLVAENESTRQVIIAIDKHGIARIPSYIAVGELGLNTDLGSRTLNVRR